MAYDMYEEPVGSKRTKMPRSTVMVVLLGTIALCLCTASALVGGLFVGVVVAQGGGFGNERPARDTFEFAPDLRVTPTPVASMPTVPPPDPMGGEMERATATPFPMNPTGGDTGGATATPMPFDSVPTPIP